MKKLMTAAILVTLLWTCSGCSVVFFSNRISEELDVRATQATSVARTAKAGALDETQLCDSLTGNADYFVYIDENTGFMKPIYMNAKYTQIMIRMKLASAEAAKRFIDKELANISAVAVLGHQAVYLMMLQDARDGKADEDAATYRKRLYNVVDEE